MICDNIKRRLQEGFGMQNILKNRVQRNTTLALRNGVFAVYEAITNAIHAIEDRGNSDGLIHVEFLSKNSSLFGSKGGDFDIVNITDNGIGFTPDNVDSFRKLDSVYKADRGCHGIGRLLFLKVFERASIVSTYRDGDSLYTVKLGLDLEKEDEVSLPEKVDGNPTLETCVSLKNIKSSYYKGFPKTKDAIAKNILEHFYAYFLSPSPPNIVVSIHGERINLLDVYDEESTGISIEKITIKGHVFELTHVKKRTVATEASIHLLADSRLVKSVKTKIRGLLKKMSDAKGDFSYCCYVSSDYLNENVLSDRGGFSLHEESDIVSIGIQEIISEVEARISEYLVLEIGAVIAERTKVVKDHIKNVSPQYTRLTTILSDDDLYCEKSKGDDLDSFLMHKKHEIEKQAAAQAKEIQKDIDTDNYRQKLANYLTLIDNVQKMDLADYICHRKVVIDILMSLLKSKKSSEKDLHNLLFAQYGEAPSDSNLWLLDEHYIYFDGVSEFRLDKMSYKGKPLIRENLTEEERKVLHSREKENKLSRRPDILLFPDEGECIILELKDTGVRIERHLQQIQHYASIIYTFSNFKINKFYGYFLGENFSIVDLKMSNPNYSFDPLKRYYSLDCDRPLEVVNMMDVEAEGGKIITRVMKYSDILTTANMRNNVFFEKLGLQ